MSGKLWPDMTPVEKMRAREESIILMRDGTKKRLKVHQGCPPLFCYIVTGGEKIPVRQLRPPGETSKGLPIEWEEVTP